MLAASVCLVALIAGCGQSAPKPPPSEPGPSLADQLTAANELAEIEEERYQKTVDRREELRMLRDDAIGLNSPETVEKAERTLEKLEAAVEEARVARDAARNKVRTLAHQLTAE
jgi:TolA-binding protein